MNRQVALGFLAVMIIAAFFRFWNLETTPPGLYPDEAINGNNALEALTERDWNVFYPENNGREGLFINIQSFFLAIFGNNSWSLRVPSALFGFLTVAGIFFLSRLLFKGLPYENLAALFSSYLVAVSFWHVNFSRIGFRAILAPLFLVWSLYFLLRFSKNIGSNVSQTLSAALGGVMLGLGFHTYIAFRVAPLIILVPLAFAWFKYKKGASRISCFPCLAALFIFFAIIAASPLLIYFAQNPVDFLGRTSQISIFTQDSPLLELGKNMIKTLGMFWIAGDYNWRHNFAGAPQLFWPVGAFFIVGIFAAIFSLFKKNGDQNEKESNLLLLIWLVIMTLPMVISSEGLPHALRAIILIPPIFILASLGLIKIINHLKTWIEIQKLKYPQYVNQLNRIKKELIILIASILFLTGVGGYNQYFIKWAGQSEVYFAFNANYKELAEQIIKFDETIPKYIVVNASGVEVRGIPMPVQSIMFFTNTFDKKNQMEKNIFYLRPEEIDYESLRKKDKIIIALLEPEENLAIRINREIPGLKPQALAGNFFLVK